MMGVASTWQDLAGVENEAAQYVAKLKVTQIMWHLDLRYIEERICSMADTHHTLPDLR